MPQISIIVPNYNTEKYLPRCLKSLVNQTFKDIEIIVIDDGSKDDSVKIIRQFAEKDNRIKVITQKNSGPATARNKGLDAATGKYLMFCDSDDWYEPNMCEVMFNTIEKKKTDVVCCHNFFDYEKKLPKSEDSRVIDFQNINYYFCPNKQGKKKLTPKNIMATNVMLWNKIWRHDIIKQYKIRFPDGHEHDDDAIWYTFACVAKDIYFLKKPLYHYFIRTNSIMSSQYNKKPKNKYDSITIANYILDFLFKNQLIEKHKNTMAMIFLYKLQYIKKQGFFTIKELINICQQTNKEIQNILGLNSMLIIIEDVGVFLVNKKNYLQLIYEHTYHKIRIIFHKTQWNTYDLITNNLEWQYRRQLRKNKKTKKI